VKFCRGGVDHREDCSRRLLVHAKFHSMSARLGVYGTPKVVNIAKFENIRAPESLARFLGKQIFTFVSSSRASPCSKLGGIHVRDWKLWVCFPHTSSACSGETIRLIGKVRKDRCIYHHGKYGGLRLYSFAHRRWQTCMMFSLFFFITLSNV